MNGLMFYLFIEENILYYIIVIVFAFKDNRAFGKYVCAVGAFSIKAGGKKN